MNNVILWRGITKLDLPVDRVLENNIGRGLKSIVLMGEDEDGEYYFASSLADGGDVLWLMEHFKKRLLDSGED